MTAVDAARTELVDLRVGRDRARALREGAIRWPSWTLTERQLCDLELLAVGGFSPLTTFTDAADYVGILADMRLMNGAVWPIPIPLDLGDATIRALGREGKLALRDAAGTLLAVLTVTDVYRPDRRAEAAAVFGTVDTAHPGVHYLLKNTSPNYVTGQLEVLQTPRHTTFLDLRRDPRQTRAEIADRGWQRMVAFQTRNPMHRAHQQLTLRAARQCDAGLLVHPVVGIGKPGDVDAVTRVRCYRALLPSYPAGAAMLGVLPLAMRMAGPREAVWHAIIRRNYGATHFIVGRDHAGPGADASGRPFYDPAASADLAHRLAPEIGVEIVRFRRMVYVPEYGKYTAEDEIPAGCTSLTLSGTELRQRLRSGAELPEWFTPPEVAAELGRGGSA